MHRNCYKFDTFLLAPVTDFSIFAGVSEFSGDKDIDEFLTEDAKRHFIEHMAVTYSLTDTESNIIYAFATLQNDAVRFVHGYAGFPYRSFPAVKIGRLGVNKYYQHNGAGSLLIYMIVNMMLINNRTGCRFITLDSYNKPNVIAFYESNGFIKLLPDDKNSGRVTIPMYLDMLRDEYIL